MYAHLYISRPFLLPCAVFRLGMEFFKNYFRNLLNRKSKLSLALDLIIVLLAIFIMVPQTRKSAIALVLRPTVFIYQPSLLKQSVPLFTPSLMWYIRSFEGDTCILGDFVGKPLIINYWASWCAPSLAEMGQWRSLYADYGDKVNFLFITNEKRSDVAKFVKRKKLDLPVYLPINNYPEQLSTNTLPVTFLVDADGYVLMRKSGMAQWNGQKMRAILDAMLTKTGGDNEN